MLPPPDPFANSLNGSGFDDFNITNMAEERISDGLGHYWDSATQQWMNDSGGAYVEPFDLSSDPFFGNFDAGAAENLGGRYDPSQDPFFGNFDAGAAENVGMPGEYSLGGSGFDNFNIGNMIPNSLNGPQFEDFNITNMAQPEEDLRPWEGFQPRGGGFWGGLRDIAGGAQDFLGDSFQRGFEPISNAGSGLWQMSPGVQLGQELIDRNPGLRQTLLEDQLSGNALVEDISGGRINLDELPYGLDYATDAALAPATWLTAGLGPSVPVIGSAFGGRAATRFAGEAAIGAAGLFGAEQGAEYGPAFIPNYDLPETPDWLRTIPYAGAALYEGLDWLGDEENQALAGGVVGGLAGGLGVFGGARGLRALQPEDFAPEGPVRNMYPDTGILPRLGEEAQFPAFGGVDVPPGRAMPQFAGAADEDEIARLAKIERKRLEQDIAKERVMFPTPEAQAMLDELRTDDGAILRFAAERLQNRMTMPNGLTLAEQSRLGDILTVIRPIDDTALNEPRRALLDALTEQRKMRESGAIEEIKHQGRVRQARALGESMDTIRSGGGGTFDENLSAMTGSMRGAILPQGQPLNLAEETMQALQREIIDAVDTRKFDAITAIKGLDRANQGLYVQPAQMRELRKVFGDEVADAVAATNANRIQTIAELTPADLAEIDRLAKVDGRRIATLEVEARRQHELADNLLKKSRMDPTNQRLKTLADNARARALKQENDADRLLADRAEKWAGKQAEKAETAAQREAKVANEREVRGQLKAEAAAKRQADDEWIAGLDDPRLDEFGQRLGRIEDAATRRLGRQQDKAKADLSARRQADWANALDGPGPDEFARTAARNEETATRDLARRQARAKEVQTDKRATQEWKASGQEAIAKAEKLIEKEAVSPALAQQAREVVAEQVRRQGILLNAVGDEAPGLIRQLYASVTGEVTDPWVSQLITQRGFVRGALQSSGYSDTTARAIANLLVDAEVKMRYGANPPEWVVSSLKQASPASRKGAANSLQGAAMITQEMKNLMFSIGDFAILGQQALKTLITQPVSLSVGLGNRVANKMLAYANLHAIDTNTAMGRLPRNITDLMDGGATIARGAVDVNPEDGTLLRHIPGLKKVDEQWTKEAEFLSNLQFKTVLGTMRDISNEGNLVLLKLTGSDIQNPIVRQRSMKWANAFTSAGTLAQRSERAMAERGLVLSASMTRAQVQQLGLLSRVLSNRENAVLGVSAALGTIGSMYAIGKVINDRYGVNPFEFDPSQPGFGQVTLKGGLVIDVFPQDQLVRVLTRTARLAAEQPEDMWSEVGKEWTKFGMGRSSPPLQYVEKAAGYGYQPGEGWKFGDYGEGMSKGDRLLNNLPLPPIFGQLKESGLDPVRTPLNIAGVTSFEESDYNALDRAVKNDPSFGGKSYREITDPLEKQRAQDLYGKLEPFGPEGKRAAEVLEEKIKEQTASDTKLWETDKEEWRKDYSERKKELAITNEEIYHKLNLETKDPVLKGFYAAIDAAKGPDGKIDWDKVDEYRASIDPKDDAYISTRTGLVKIDTPATQAFKRDYDAIKGSGFFERSDDAWDATQGSVPGLDGYKDYYDWRDTLRAEIVKEWTAQGLIPEFAAKEADKFLDKQTPAKAMEHYGTMWRDQWMQSDPEAARLAWRYGYWEPNAAQAKWLNQVFAGQSR